MVSQTAFFVKDVFGPRGSVSIVPQEAVKDGVSDSVEAHTKTESIRVHYADIDENNEFLKADEWIRLEDEPNHQDLCNREQLFFQKAIIEDLDLTKQSEDALNSLRIAFACDEAVKTKKVIDLS